MTLAEVHDDRSLHLICAPARGRHERSCGIPPPNTLAHRRLRLVQQQAIVS